MEESESDYNFKIRRKVLQRIFTKLQSHDQNYTTLNGFVNNWNCAKVLQ